MSKGNPIVKVRVPRDVLAEVNNAIDSHARRSSREPHTMSSWLLDAIKEKLAHIARSKKSSAKRRRSETVAHPLDIPDMSQLD